MLPNRVSKMFRSLVTLRVLNVLAVGFSLAAAAGSVLGKLLDPNTGWVSSLSTLFYGLLWALMLRHRATIGRSPVRWGWLLSIPLAIANSATAVVLAFAFSEPNASPLNPSTVSNVVGLAIMGATFGAIVWIPALVATLACFGLPIAWSQGCAKQGLAGEEQGEMVVGTISAIIALGAALLLDTWNTRLGIGRGIDEETIVGIAVVGILAFVGATTGALAAILAFMRSRARRAFVREVEAGKITNFRVDATAAGKVLVRVTSAGEGYRVANFDEPIAVLDDSGNAKQPFLAHQQPRMDR